MTHVAVVAGVGPGLGASIARRFAAEGCSVALLARSAPYLESLADELDDGPGAGLAVPTDLSEPAEIRAAFEEIRASLGPVDTLVNHAGGGAWKGLERLSVDELDDAMAVGVRGAFVCAQEAVDDMLADDDAESAPAGAGESASEKTGESPDDGDGERVGEGAAEGTIVFTGATSSVRGREGALAFSAAKFGARGLAESMARELGPQGVHVAHVVLDGGIRPPDRSVEDESSFLDPDDIAEAYWRLVEQDPTTMSFEVHLTNGTQSIEFL